MLVNTSFNLFGEPLVITPCDAVKSYYRSGQMPSSLEGLHSFRHRRETY
jgi:predicted NodU family carbamoyl transferase